MQPIKIRLLVLEDIANDAELEIAELEQAGFDCDWKRVETRESFLASLESPDFDLILSDYALPSFDGLTALSLLLEYKVDIPFILVSGTLGEKAAIDSLKAGATDYVLKTRLSRLAPVVKRALQEQSERRERERTERELQSANERFRIIVETAADAIITVDHQGKIVAWNPAAQKLFGYSADEIIGRHFIQILPEQHREGHQSTVSQMAVDRQESGIGQTVERVGLEKNGHEFPMDLSLATWTLTEERFVTAIVRDITKHKQVEKVLKQHNVELEQFNKLATGRELRMVELKKEINTLCRKWDEPERYP